MLLTFLTTTTLLFSLGVTQRLEKETAYKDGLPFKDVLKDNLDTHNPQVSAWEKGKPIPQACFEQLKDKCTTTDIEVFSTTYSDCDIPWTMCRCPDAQVSQQDFVDWFGRVPVKIRQYTRHAMARADTAANAYAFDGDIVINGPVDNVQVFIHETGHNVDGRAPYEGKQEGTSFSSSQQFKDAVDKDTCVPDDYALSNLVEDFAQLMVVTTADTVSGIEVPDCFKNQFQLVKDSFGAIEQKDGQCGERAKDSPLVDPSTGSPARRMRARSVETRDVINGVKMF